MGTVIQAVGPVRTDDRQKIKTNGDFQVWPVLKGVLLQEDQAAFWYGLSLLSGVNQVQQFIRTHAVAARLQYNQPQAVIAVASL